MRSLSVRALFLLSVSLLLAGSAMAAACPTRTWVAGQEIELDDWARYVVPIDIDGDGILDLAASLDEPPTRLVTMRVAGDGTFAAPVTLYTSPNTIISGSITDLGAADVNGDGYEDLIVANLSDFLIFPGSASGLGTPTTMTLGFWMSDFTIGNFDADPALEMVISSASPSRFYVYDNVGGSFSETRRVSSDTGFIADVVSADFDGDSRHDVAVARRIDEETGTVDVYFRNADGSFTAPLVLAAGSFPTDLATTDFDLDGLPDLAAINWYDNSVTVYLNDGSRQFTSSTLNAGYPGGFGNAASLIVDDVDQDGVADILVGAVNSGSALATFMGVGDGTFRSPSYFTSFDGQFNRFIDALGLADFDDDGDLDLAISASNTIIIASPACATQVTLTTESPLISTTAEATLNVSIAGFGGTAPNPIGTVTLREGVTTVGTAAPNAAGQVTFVVPPMSAGDHTFTAEFSGNALLSGATSNAATQKVTASQTTTTIDAPETQPVYGTAWPIEISVNGPTGGGYESVKVFIDGVPQDHYTYNPLELNLTPGPHTIYAKFYGTSQRPASTSATLNVTALKGTPAMFVTGATTVRAGQAHALQVDVAVPTGTARPTGTVQLITGNAVVGAGTLANGFVIVNATLPRGSHDVRVVYSGDANFNTRQAFITLHVLPDQPLAINARGVGSSMHISYVVPTGTTSMTLYRRTVGGAWEPATGWNNGTGFDAFSATFGVVYEYQLHTVTSGTAMQSNIDGALLFTDDPLFPGTTRIKRAHFTEMRDAVNLLRSAAGLAPFAFSATFNASSIVRAEHLLSLQTAAAEARSALGMSAASFDAFNAGSVIGAVHVRQTRDAVR